MNAHKAGVTEPSDHLGIRVRPHLMLNEELKNLDSFLCIPAHDLGNLGQFPQNAPIPEQYWERGISQPTEGLGNRVKSHFM